MARNTDVDRIVGMTGYGSDGEKIGKVTDLYIDNSTNEPSWVALRTGLLGMKESLVPLAEAHMDDEGVHFPFTKETVKDAPDVGNEGDLSPHQEAELFRYYGLPYQDPNVQQAGEPVTLRDAPPQGSPAKEPLAEEASSETVPAVPERDKRTPIDEPPAQPPVPQQPPGMRLRRRVVHETQTIDVPVEREEYVVERDDDTGLGTPER